MQPSLTLFDLQPGKTVLDRFAIQRATRDGGMSAVFEVLDGEDRRELQVFPAAMFEDPGQSDNFASGLQAWCSIENEHVLDVREVRRLEDGTVVLVTESPGGTSLRAWLNEHGHMEPEQVRSLGLALLDGLQAIHSSGAVHGDVKPNTVYVGDSGAALLVDGGITSGLWDAKQLGDKTALIGTPFYSPVEQFGGESPDVRSDVYNLATVLYELSTGVVPWPGKSFLEVFQSKLQSRPPRMRDRAPSIRVPEELEEAIVGGLIAEARDRYQTAAQFAERLQAAKL